MISYLCSYIKSDLTKTQLSMHLFIFLFFYFLLLDSVYTALPLSQGLDRVKGGTIHMKTVKYVHTKLCLSVYTEYY